MTVQMSNSKISSEKTIKELKVTPIRNGTVIDHIEKGMALKVLKILGISGVEDYVVTVAMGVPSKNTSRKDIVKIEDRELDENELNKIALIAPTATINIVRDYTIERKHEVELPDVVEGILTCENSNCISNQKNEPVDGKCIVISRNPVLLRCYYCDREQIDIVARIR